MRKLSFYSGLAVVALLVGVLPCVQGGSGERVAAQGMEAWAAGDDPHSEYLDWCEAYAAILDGASVARKAWGVGIWAEYCRCDPALRLTCADGAVVGWSPTADDLTSEDWYCLGQ